MTLPNADGAVIPPEKLRDYLLSRRHPLGRFKAAFFAGLGYTEEGWAQLERDLREQHLTRDADELEPTRYGRKFVITAPISGPSGRSALLRIIRSGETAPRFVTACRGGR